MELGIWLIFSINPILKVIIALKVFIIPILITASILITPITIFILYSGTIMINIKHKLIQKPLFYELGMLYLNFNRGEQQIKKTICFL